MTVLNLEQRRATMLTTTEKPEYEFLHEFIKQLKIAEAEIQAAIRGTEEITWHAELT